MKHKITIMGFMLLAAAATVLSQGKFSGYMFGDYYYNVQRDANPHFNCDAYTLHTIMIYQSNSRPGFDLKPIKPLLRLLRPGRTTNSQAAKLPRL